MVVKTAVKNWLHQLSFMKPGYIRRWNTAIQRGGEYVEKLECVPVMYSFILKQDV